MDTVRREIRHFAHAIGWDEQRMILSLSALDPIDCRRRLWRGFARLEVARHLHDEFVVRDARLNPVALIAEQVAGVELLQSSLQVVL